MINKHHNHFNVKFTRHLNGFLRQFKTFCRLSRINIWVNERNISPSYKYLIEMGDHYYELTIFLYIIIACTQRNVSSH